MNIQVNLGNKKSKQAKWASYYKRCYHRWLRHQPINEKSYGGHVVKKYTGGWMY